jgi:hypothetical protein
MVGMVEDGTEKEVCDENMEEAYREGKDS